MPLVLLRLLWRGIKAPEYKKRWLERFGIGSAPDQKGGIWVHAVSLGESIAATPLIQKFIDEYPEQPITVTCMTPTGSEHIQKTFGYKVHHCYLPYDIPLLLRFFIKKIQPNTLVIMETELWPNLIHTAKVLGVKVILANARLSERSAKGYKKVSALSYPMMQQLDLIAAQSPADGQRFIELGLDKYKLAVTGSIKFDIQVPDSSEEFSQQFKKSWGPDRPVLMVASTHEGEDVIWLKYWPEVLKKVPDALLMIVPRHPERFNSVAQLIKQQGFDLARRSKPDSVSANTQVFLGDSLGEMMGFYAACDVAFIGGSLVENGGHNPLEAAALNKAIMIGPSYFNFQDIVTQLIEGNGIDVLAEHELATKAIELLLDQEKRREKGIAANAVVQKNLGSLQRLYDLI